MCSGPRIRCFRTPRRWRKTPCRHPYAPSNALPIGLCVLTYGKSAVAHLAELDFLGPELSCAHGVWLDDEDIERLAAARTTICHNPSSNLRLKRHRAGTAHAEPRNRGGARRGFERHQRRPGITAGGAPRLGAASRRRPRCAAPHAGGSTADGDRERRARLQAHEKAHPGAWQARRRGADQSGSPDRRPGRERAGSPSCCSSARATGTSTRCSWTARSCSPPAPLSSTARPPWPSCASASQDRGRRTKSSAGRSRTHCGRTCGSSTGAGIDSATLDPNTPKGNTMKLKLCDHCSRICLR